MSLPPLRDIHLPEAPALWPPAPGWWLLAALLLALLTGMAVLARRAWRRRRWRQVLSRAVAELAAVDEPTAFAAAASELLRRVARHRDPAAATLVGEPWLDWLDRQGGGEAFRRGPGRILVDAPYQRRAELDRAALLALIRHWLRQQPC